MVAEATPVYRSLRVLVFKNASDAILEDYPEFVCAPQIVADRKRAIAAKGIRL
jgi:hypothetical protein